MLIAKSCRYYPSGTGLGVLAIKEGGKRISGGGVNLSYLIKAVYLFDDNLML